MTQLLNELDPTTFKRVLPRGSNCLDPQVVQLSQRGRLIEAVAYCIHQKGYAATTVKDLIERAGISKATFYQIFKDKEDCYLHSFVRISSAHIKSLNEAYSDPKLSVQEKLERSIMAYLEHLMQNTVYANSFFALAPYSTANVLVELRKIKEHYIALLRHWFESQSIETPTLKLPDDVYRILIEGVLNFLRIWIMRGFDTPLTQVHVYICYVFYSGLGLHALAQEKLNLMDIDEKSRTNEK